SGYGSMVDNSSTSSMDKAIAKSSTDLLDRYRSGQRFSASDYEGFAKSALDGLVSDEGLASMFDPDASDLTGDEVYDDMFMYKAGAGSFDDVNWSIYNMGRLTYDGDSFT